MHLIRSVSITTENFEISQHHHREVWDQSASPQRSLSFVRIKVPNGSKSYLACYKCIEWLDNSKLNNFSENSVWSLILLSSWWHSCNFIDIWRLIDACPLLPCCSHESQKYDWKITNTEETERKKKKGKIFYSKTDIGLLDFLRNITFKILATFFLLWRPCQTSDLNLARHTFFKRISNFEFVGLFVCEIYLTLTSVSVLHCSF